MHIFTHIQNIDEPMSYLQSDREGLPGTVEDEYCVHRFTIRREGSMLAQKCSLPRGHASFVDGRYVI
jgi:hypothetical protein